MAYSIMKRIRYSTGHRLINYEGKCANLHGHNYTAEFYITAPEPDDRGFLMDFGDLKTLVKTWIDDNWDHGFVLHEQDTDAIAAVKATSPHKLYLLPANPTAENMAIHLLHEVCPPLLNPLGVHAWRVVVWETEDSFAEAFDREHLPGSFGGGATPDSAN